MPSETDLTPAERRQLAAHFVWQLSTQTSDAIADEPQTLGAARTTYPYYFPENLRMEEDTLP